MGHASWRQRAEGRALAREPSQERAGRAGTALTRPGLWQKLNLPSWPHLAGDPQLRCWTALPTPTPLLPHAHSRQEEKEEELAVCLPLPWIHRLQSPPPWPGGGKWGPQGPIRRAPSMPPSRGSLLLGLPSPGSGAPGSLGKR